MGPKIYNSGFLENACNGFDQVSVVYGAHLHAWNHIGGSFIKIAARALRAQTRDVSFLKSKFNDQTVVRIQKRSERQSI